MSWKNSANGRCTWEVLGKHTSVMRWELKSILLHWAGRWPSFRIFVFVGCINSDFSAFVYPCCLKGLAVGFLDKPTLQRNACWRPLRSHRSSGVLRDGMIIWLSLWTDVMFEAHSIIGCIPPSLLYFKTTSTKSGVVMPKPQTLYGYYLGVISPACSLTCTTIIAHTQQIPLKSFLHTAGDRGLFGSFHGEKSTDKASDSRWCYCQVVVRKTIILWVLSVDNVRRSLHMMLASSSRPLMKDIGNWTDWCWKEQCMYYDPFS